MEAKERDTSYDKGEKGQLAPASASSSHDDRAIDLEQGRLLEKGQREQRASSHKKVLRPTGPLRKHTSQAVENIVGFEGPNDQLNAHNWPISKKIRVTLLLGLTSGVCQFTSTIYASGIPEFSSELGFSEEVGTLVVALFLFGYVPGPMLWAPLSEDSGRKLAIFAPFFVFICFNAATATSTNAQTFFITRFFGGFFACAPVVVVSGAIADMFDPRARLVAVVGYAFVLVAGPLCAPVIGSAIATSYLGWRWLGYISTILAGVTLAIGLLCVPETHGPSLLTSKAQRLRRETGNFVLHSKHEEQKEFGVYAFFEKNVKRPIELIYKEPIVLAIDLYNGFVYAILYLLFESLSIVYEDGRGWSPVVASLPFLSVMIGCFIAGATNITYNQLRYIKLVDHYAAKKEKVPPEQRLPPMCLGGVLMPISLFWFAWTADTDVFWLSSVLALGLFGVAFLLIFQSGLNYLIDSFLPVAASTVASNTIVRSALGGALPIVARPFFLNLGTARAGSVLGGISFGLMFIPPLFYLYGHKLRAMSRYAID